MFFPPCFVFTTAGIVNLSRASVYVPAAGRWPKRVPLPVGCQCFPCCSLSLIVLTLARSLSLSLVGVLSFGLCRNQKSNSILFAGVPVLLSWPVLVFTNRRELVVWLTLTHTIRKWHMKGIVCDVGGRPHTNKSVQMFGETRFGGVWCATQTRLCPFVNWRAFNFNETLLWRKWVFRFLLFYI